MPSESKQERIVHSRSWGEGGGGGGGAAAPGECALPDHMLYTNYSGTKISS